MPAERRFDLHQTSSGRGLNYKPEYYFPASDFKVKRLSLYNIIMIILNLHETRTRINFKVMIVLNLQTGFVLT